MMKQKILNYGFALALGLGIICTQSTMSTADDAKTPAKAPDFSKYVYVKNQTGEVVKADDKKISITYKWTVNTQPNPKFAPRFVEKHQDYEFQLLPESLVRSSFLPKKVDDKGKKVEYTQKEKDALKTPIGVTGYAASTSDLTPGTLVDITLIRDKSIAGAKATDEDLRVKYVIIQPPTTAATPPAKN
jgi:hypothetical protein